MILNIQLARKINDALNKKVICHSNYKIAFNICRKLLRRSEYGLNPCGLLLHGPTGSGKSTIIENILRQNKEDDSDNSVVSTYLTGSLNFSQIISSILSDMGDPNPNNGTGHLKLERLTKGLNARNVKLIIINEFQHLIPENGSIIEMLNEALNAFKSILDKTKASLLIVGTHEILKLRDHDSQIRRRMRTPICIRHLRYLDDRPEWRGIISSFVKLIDDFGVSVNCSNFDDRMYLATKGSIGAAVKLLTEAITLASESELDTLTKEILTEATEQIIDPLDGYLNAFKCSKTTLDRLANENYDITPIAKRYPKGTEVFATR